MSRSSDQIGKIKKQQKKLDIEYFLISVQCSLNPNMAFIENNSDIAVMEMSLEHRYMKISEIL